MLEEVPKAKQPVTPINKLVLQDYNRHLQRDEDGNFIVRLPFKPDVTPLGKTRPQALKRFLSLERRLHQSNEHDDYSKVVREYITSGHAERVPDQDLNKLPSQSFYLAHHAVYKDSTTTPLRVVFDGSMKSSSGVSLNERLLVGPTVHPPLNDVLIRFRQHPYVVTTDVSKMYRAVHIAPEDRDYHRFLWREKATDPIIDYRMKRVTFGIASAAFLATNSILHLAETHESELPLATTAVKESFYVDDGLISTPTEEQAILVHQELQNLFSKGGFKLRKWDSNSSKVVQAIPLEIRSARATSSLPGSNEFIKTLGIEYNCHQDYFRFSTTDLAIKESKLTKRTVLSDSAKIFDPLGLISCVTIVVKIIFQRLWQQGIGWDDPLPHDILQDWLKWREQLPTISSLKIPRCYSSAVDGNIVSRQLIGFSDASEKAYCGIVYMRSVDTAGGVHVSLIESKTKVAPIKKATLPRLELCGAHLLAQLLKHVQDVLNIPTEDLYAFTDSTIVLYWIYGSSQRFKTFEANRIAEIQDYVPPEKWKHVGSEDNPADAGSRGILPEEIHNHHLWWSGPSWLKKHPSNWTFKLAAPLSLSMLASSGIRKEDLNLKENKEEIVLLTASSSSEDKPVIDINKFSTLVRLVRVTAWVFRVATGSHLFTCTPLSASELTRAETFLIKKAQADMFPEVIQALQKNKPLYKSNKLQPLNPFLDSDGLLRVGGRLSQSTKDYQARHPAILAGNHHLVQLIIQGEHKRLCHGGPKLVLGSLQDRFHIVGARGIVRKYIRQCITCLRVSPKITNQLMGQLPADRVRATYVNDKVSVDYAGPLSIKIGSTRKPVYKKAYIAVFVCLETKACHLELISDLTAEAFIATLRRFVARRGKPSVIRSDNATCFTRANKDLKELFELLRQQSTQDSLANLCSSQGIQWKFSPPTGPHHGSVWENGVKACKHHLRRIVGETKLNFEEMTTVLCQIESCLNSRPLAHTLDSNDDDGITTLTPGHFLIGRPLEAIPDYPHSTNRPTSLLKRWQLCQSLVNHFWKRWSTEYLQCLQRFNKWKFQNRNFAVGDIVLSKDDRLPPCQWALARITRVHPGPDQRVRVVSVKTARGIYVRPITKICLLLAQEQQ